MESIIRTETKEMAQFLSCIYDVMIECSLTFSLAKKVIVSFRVGGCVSLSFFFSVCVSVRVKTNGLLKADTHTHGVAK